MSNTSIDDVKSPNFESIPFGSSFCLIFSVLVSTSGVSSFFSSNSCFLSSIRSVISLTSIFEVVVALPTLSKFILKILSLIFVIFLVFSSLCLSMLLLLFCLLGLSVLKSGGGLSLGGNGAAGGTVGTSGFLSVVGRSVSL